MKCHGVGPDDMVVAPSYLGLDVEYASSLTNGKMGIALNTKAKAMLTAKGLLSTYGTVMGSKIC